MWRASIPKRACPLISSPLLSLPFTPLALFVTLLLSVLILLARKVRFTAAGGHGGVCDEFADEGLEDGVLQAEEPDARLHGAKKRREMRRRRDETKERGEKRLTPERERTRTKKPTPVDRVLSYIVVCGRAML